MRDLAILRGAYSEIIKIIVLTLLILSTIPVNNHNSLLFVKHDSYSMHLAKNGQELVANVVDFALVVTLETFK